MRTPRPEQSTRGTGQRSGVVAWLVAVVWLALSVAGLWGFQAQGARNEPASIFDVENPQTIERWFQEEVAGTQNRGENVQATVVSIATPGCTCDGSALAQLAAVSMNYRPRGVRFMAIGQTVLANPALSSLRAAPAALVFDRAGRLSYYGPYAEAAFCGTGTGPLVPVLDRILSGHPAKAVPVVGRACGCT